MLPQKTRQSLSLPDLPHRRVGASVAREADFDLDAPPAAVKPSLDHQGTSTSGT